MVLKYFGIKVPTRIRTETVAITDPNIYLDIVNAPEVIPIRIVFTIVNNEGRSLWFKITLVSAPEGYSMDDVEVGEVVDGGKVTVAVTLNRTKPASTDFMEHEESVTLRVTAYTDSAYTAEFGHVDIDFSVFIINSDHPDWNTVAELNFDDGSLGIAEAVSDIVGTEGNCSTSTSVSDEAFVSPPYSVRVRLSTGAVVTNRCNRYIGLEFPIELPPSSKRYLIAYVRKEDSAVQETRVVMGETEYYFNWAEVGRWFKFVVPVPEGVSRIKITQYVYFQGANMTVTFYIDSIKVIAR